MRVVIAEDDTLFREGLTLVLTVAGVDVIGTAPDAESLVRLSAETKPDAVITDIRMPPDHTDDGLRAALHIRRTQPGVGVVVLSQFVQRRYAVELFGENPAGAGYLLKQRVADVARFAADVRQVAAGGTVLDSDVVEVMLSRARRGRTETDQLTPRQQEVLSLVAQGRSNGAIAARLRISEKAVVQHISNIYDEFHIPTNPDDHRRVLAVMRYLS